MKKYLLLFMCIALLSCEKEEEPRDKFNLDIDIEFSVQDVNGKDLLAPEHPNKLAEEDIKIYFQIEGKKVEVFEEHLVYPRHFLIYKHENEYRIRLFPYESNGEAQTITYIQWHEEDTDTVAVSFERTSQSIIRNEVWLNGELVYKRSDDPNEDAYFTITK